MYEIAEQVGSWLAEGRNVLVAQVIEASGFSSRDESAALAWTSGAEPAGTLLPGIGAAQLGDEARVVEIAVDAGQAAAAGPACAGTATVLVTSAASYPAALWARLVAREPVCLTTPLTAAGPGEPTLFTPRTIRDAHAFGSAIPRLFGRGTSNATIVEHDGERRAVVSLWPVLTLVVVGDGLIAEALTGAAGLLGWTAQLVAEFPTADALRASDAVVVLSHDRAVDGPALLASLRSAAGYVGALGSRRTQAARRAWLLEHGADEQEIDRIHGPAGLDLDAHTPGEIAVSIAAEILACRSGSSGAALRDRPGPVHTAGVNAPPPRYPAR